MSLHYLLDGYNILYQIPEFHDKELGAQRQGLIDRVERYKPQGNNAVTIFFDGKPGRTRPQERKHIRIIFTFEQTADECIKDRVQDASNSKAYVVVTNDREIQYAVRAEGAKVISVEELCSKCSQRRSIKGQKVSRKISTSNQQAITDELKDIWLKKDL